jgi:DNA polymerase-4
LGRRLNAPGTPICARSHEARAFGVGSGMSSPLAARKAPSVVILPVDAAAYEAASAQVMGVLRGMDGAVVEVLGWDEAFIGVRTGDPEAFAHRVQTEVLAATGCTARLGSATTGSGRRSPRGSASHAGRSG